MTSRRVATIDIGTNSVLLLVAEQAGTEVRVLLDRATVTRLGQSVDQTRRLHPDACARTYACLRDYKKNVGELGVDALLATGTSAVRDADNAAEFLDEATHILGSPPVVLSGEEEARLSFRGALHELGQNGLVTLLDIGGGSTEIVQGTLSPPHVSIHRAVSVNVGSVRLTERYVRHDPPTPEELALVRLEAQNAFREVNLWPRAKAPPCVVGVAGTVTTLAAVAHHVVPYEASKIHGISMGLDFINKTLHDLILMPLSLRKAVAGLEPQRAEVILAGGILLQEAMSTLRATALHVSNGGLRWGLLLETLWAHEGHSVPISLKHPRCHLFVDTLI